MTSWQTHTCKRANVQIAVPPCYVAVHRSVSDFGPGPEETNMGFLSFTAADVGTASQPTASGRDAATNVAGSQRKGSQKDWARKWREEQQQGSRLGQRTGRGAVLKRKLRRECEGIVKAAVEAAAAAVMQAVDEATVAAAMAVAVATAAGAVAAERREVQRMSMWVDVLKGELTEVDGVTAGVRDGHEQGCESVHSDENELCKENGEHGAGRSVGCGEELVGEGDGQGWEQEQAGQTGFTRRQEEERRQLGSREREAEETRVVRERQEEGTSCSRFRDEAERVRIRLKGIEEGWLKRRRAVSREMG
jgi:hypothetical protein